LPLITLRLLISHAAFRRHERLRNQRTAQRHTTYAADDADTRFAAPLLLPFFDTPMMPFRRHD